VEHSRDVKVVIWYLVTKITLKKDTAWLMLLKWLIYTLLKNASQIYKINLLKKAKQKLKMLKKN
jgi:hypothetical protein